MSRLWNNNDDNDWIAETLGFDQGEPVAHGPARLIAFGKGAEREVALLLPLGERAWVNGQPVISGLKVLEHRDEILIGSQTLYFSAESTPVPVEYRLPEDQRRPRCTLCRMAIEDSQTAVACPRCGRWFHELDAIDDQPEKKCWTYKDRCLCGHPTSLSGEPVWRPDQEEDCA